MTEFCLVRTSETVAIFERLQKCSWFSRVGKMDLPKYKYVDSWELAMSLVSELSDKSWTKILNDAMNQVSLAAFNADRDQFQNRWNFVAKHVREIVQGTLVGRLEEEVAKQFIPANVVNECRSMMTLCLIPRMYEAGLNDPLHDECVEILTNGHFPCGFDGDFPNGRIVVY